MGQQQWGIGQSLKVKALSHLILRYVLWFTLESGIDLEWKVKGWVGYRHLEMIVRFDFWEHCLVRTVGHLIVWSLLSSFPIYVLSCSKWHDSDVSFLGISFLQTCQSHTTRPTREQRSLSWLVGPRGVDAWDGLVQLKLLNWWWIVELNSSLEFFYTVKLLFCLSNQTESEDRSGLDQTLPLHRTSPLTSHSPTAQ